MFRNYLVMALRNIAKHKLHSIINIAGLAVGLACTIFVLLFIRDELSYDTWIPRTENLYRIEKTSYIPGREPFATARIPFLMPAAMRDEIPEVTAMTRLNYNFMTLFAGDRQFLENVVEVDPNFFSVIEMPLIEGDPASVFRDPESLVLSESAARKYFGSSNAVGKIIKTTLNCETTDTECLGRLIPLKVTGVIRDMPSNSHFDGEVFMPNTSIADRIGSSARQSWSGGGNGFGYVRLAPGANPETVAEKVASLTDRALPPDAASQDHRKGSERWVFHLTPFHNVHLDSGRWRFNEKPPGSRTTLYGIGIVGLLILFLACFNFTNLTTALASLRAREIALRKIHGAERRQLIVQFLGEAVLMALLSLVVALALAELLQPAFAHLLQHPIAMHYDSGWVLLLLLIAVMTGLLSGAYPALVLSGFRPSTMLRTGDAGYGKSSRLQKSLVVFQFAVSIGLGITVMVVFDQINFARNIDLGIHKDNLLVIPGGGLVTLAGRESFIQKLKSNPGVLDVAVTEAIPFGTYGVGLATARMPDHSKPIALNRLTIGTHTAQLLGIRLIAGRFLSDSYAQDQIVERNSGSDQNSGHNILIDDIAAANLGLAPRKAVGRTIVLGKSHVQIVGVVANVKFGGAREPAMATMFVYNPQSAASVLVRLRPDTIPQTLSFIDRTWHDFAPTKAMDRWFLSDRIDRQYRADQRQGELFAVFVGIAIFISCLGLFGLTAFTAQRRNKEIGIRKVFGARTRDLVFLLLWQFSIPVLIANLIAWPVAGYWLHGWLESFAYRVPLNPLYFATAGLVALLIAWATVLAHAVRVASNNPIHVLRSE